MPLLDWDGATAMTEIVKDDWLLQMRPDNWEHSRRNIFPVPNGSINFLEADSLLW